MRTANGIAVRGRLPGGSGGNYPPRCGQRFTLLLRSVDDVEQFVAEMRDPDPDRQEAWPPVGLLRIDGDPVCMPALVASQPTPPGCADRADPDRDRPRTLTAYCNCNYLSVLLSLDAPTWAALHVAVASISTAGLPQRLDFSIDWSSVRHHSHFGARRRIGEPMTEAPF